MIFRALDAIMGVLLLIAVVVQYNDPDPIPWTALYGAACALSVWSLIRPAGYPWVLPALVAAIALVWASTIAPGALGKVPLSELFRSWEMKNTRVEENRETLGLMIVAAWMVVLALHRLRARPLP